MAESNIIYNISRTIFRDSCTTANLIRIQCPIHQWKRLRIQTWFTILRMHIMKSCHEKIKKKLILRNRESWNKQNQNSDTFVTIKIDAENSERSHLIESMKMSACSQKWRQIVPKNCSNHNINRRLEKNQIWNQQPLFSWMPLWTSPFKFI